MVIKLGNASAAFVETFDWSGFFKPIAAMETPLPAQPAPAAPQVDDPAVDTTPHCGGGLSVPRDPYVLYGTDGEPDRFVFTAGYDQGYTIVGFNPGRDIIVIDGKTAGVDQAALDDIRAVTEDAIDGFYYNRAQGVLTISNILGVTFATSTGQIDTPDLAVADFVIV